MHRDTLQFVHDKLVNAPVGVEAREKNRIAMARIYARIAECLERHHIRCMASLIRELARRRRRREQERRLGTRCLLGTTSLTNLVLTRTCWCPFRVNMSGLFKFGRWALFESLLIYLIP